MHFVPFHFGLLTFRNHEHVIRPLAAVGFEPTTLGL